MTINDVRNMTKILKYDKILSKYDKYDIFITTIHYVNFSRDFLNKFKN